MADKAQLQNASKPSGNNESRHVYVSAVLCTICFSILLRLCVGVHSYSGMHTPPTFGDYEAQRHWMEVTTHLPPSKWYRNGPSNNLSYWGLDYPPLSGYQSWLCGKFLALFEPEAVALVTSHGYETPSSKYLMRLTVLISDLLCYLPACLACAAILYKHPGKRLGCLIAMALNPVLIITDHGHFQYNGISLGSAASAVAAIVGGYPLLGSFLFCASLSHKQMSLYMAPAFFAHLLGTCLSRKGWGRKIELLAAIGGAVIVSFAVMWAPFLTSTDSIITVFQRIFPTQRGLFEDYVANFWCVSSLIIKWKRLFEPQMLLRVCTGATMLVFLPSVISEIVAPSSRGFLLCLANAAMSFFMFSFQVHEKSILIPLLPLTMLSTASSQGVLGPSLIHAAMLSMYPLLEKDGLQEAYAGLLIIHIGLTYLLSPKPPTLKSRQEDTHRSIFERYSPWNQSLVFSLTILLGIHAIRATIAPPSRYPFLWDALMVSWSFLNFIEVFMHHYKAQLFKRKL